MASQSVLSPQQHQVIGAIGEIMQVLDLEQDTSGSLYRRLVYRVRSLLQCIDGRAIVLLFAECSDNIDDGYARRMLEWAARLKMPAASDGSDV
jgi:hypothetical protein